MAFVKLDARTLDSSLWCADPDRIVFLAALMMAEPDGIEESAVQLCADRLEPTGWLVPPGAYGIVRASSSGILRRALVDEVPGMAALARLGAPDPDSRSQANDGRRMARIDGGWVVLNFSAYREFDYTAPVRARRYRAKKKRETTETASHGANATELIPTHTPTPEIDVAGQIHAKTEACGLKVPPPPQLVIAWVTKYGPDLIAETLDDCLGQLSGKHYNYLASILAARAEDPTQRPGGRKGKTGPAVRPDSTRVDPGEALLRRADATKQLVRALESDLRYPVWARADCNREQAALWTLHVRTNFADSLSAAPTLAEWLARQS